MTPQNGRTGHSSARCSAPARHDKQSRRTPCPPGGSAVRYVAPTVRQRPSTSAGVCCSNLCFVVSVAVLCRAVRSVVDGHALVAPFATGACPAGLWTWMLFSLPGFGTAFDTRRHPRTVAHAGPVAARWASPPHAQRVQTGDYTPSPRLAAARIPHWSLAGCAGATRRSAGIGACATPGASSDPGGGVGALLAVPAATGVTRQSATRQSGRSREEAELGRKGNLAAVLRPPLLAVASRPPRRAFHVGHLITDGKRPVSP